MASLVDFAKPLKPKMSFKKGTMAFKKRRKVAEAIAAKNPGMSMGKKFAVATSAVEKQDEAD